MFIKIPNLPTTKCSLALFCASAAVASAATTVVIDFTPNADFAGSASHSTNDATGLWSSVGAGANPISYGIEAGNFNDFTLSGIDPVSGAAVSGTFNLSVELTAVGGLINRGGVGATGIGNTTISTTAETLTISNLVLNHVSGSDVFQFDGFSSVFIGNVVATETAVINGVNTTGFTPVTGTVVAGTDTAFALAPVVTIQGGAGNGLSLNGLTANFSVIPEPTSWSLLLLGAMGGLSRRRRA